MLNKHFEKMDRNKSKFVSSISIVGLFVFIHFYGKKKTL